MWPWLQNLLQFLQSAQGVAQAGQPGGQVEQPPSGAGGQGESHDAASDNVEDNGYDPVAAEAARRAAEEQRRQAEIARREREFERFLQVNGEDDFAPAESETNGNTFNWYQFLPNNSVSSYAGDSLNNSAQSFLNFVHGEVTDDAESVVQVECLLNQVSNPTTGEFAPDPVNEGLSNAGLQWIHDNLAAPLGLNSTGAAEYAIDQIGLNAESLGIDLGDVEGMTAEEVVYHYLQLLKEKESYLAEWQATNINLNHELAQIDLFAKTFGVGDEITLDMFEWAEHNLVDVDYDDPDGLENALRSHLVTGIHTYMPNPEGVDLETLSLRDLASFHQWTVLNAFDDAIDEANEIPNAQLYWDFLQAQDIQHPIWGSPLSAISTDEAFPLLSPEGTTVEGDPEHFALMEQYRYHLEGIDSDLQQSQSLFAAFEGNYEPEPPDLSLLRMALSFWEPLDYALTIPEIAQDISEGDWGNALGNAALLIIPGLSGWMNDAARAGAASDGVVFSGALDDDQLRALSSGGLNDVPQGSLSVANNVRQAAWKDSVQYIRKLGLEDTGIVPGPMYEAFSAPPGGGQAMINNRHVSLPGGKIDDVYEFPAGSVQSVMFPQGVYIDQYGFPDFSPYSEINVRIDFTGTPETDKALADAAAGFTAANPRPRGYTWHHHQDGHTMMLVPSILNNPQYGGVSHTGGAAIGSTVGDS